MNNVACFTGHRPNKLGGYNYRNPIAISVKSRMKEVVKELIDRGTTTFISGMALGVDTWGAQIVLEERESNPKIKLISAVPFLGQEFKWFKESQDEFNRIIEQADKVVVVSEGGYAPYKMQVRNEYMVNSSQNVVAVWDGTSGGTGNCVKYALKANHNPQIIKINPNTNVIEWKVK